MKIKYSSKVSISDTSDLKLIFQTVVMTNTNAIWQQLVPFVRRKVLWKSRCCCDNKNIPQPLRRGWKTALCFSFHCHILLRKSVVLCHNLHRIFNFFLLMRPCLKAPDRTCVGAIVSYWGVKILSPTHQTGWRARLLPHISTLGLIKMGLVAEPLSGTVISIGTYLFKPSGRCNRGTLV